MINEEDKLLVIHQFPAPSLQPFLNPICKQTYNALPKIYGQNKKKRYLLSHDQINLSAQHNRLARQCCSHQFEEYRRAITDVKQPKKNQIRLIGNDRKKTTCSHKKSQSNHETTIHNQIHKINPIKINKVMLPNLKTFDTEQLNEVETKHKVYRSTQGVNIGEVLIGQLKDRPVRATIIDEMRTNLNSRQLKTNQAVQTNQPSDFKQRTQIYRYKKSKTEANKSDHIPHYEYLEKKIHLRESGAQINLKEDLTRSKGSENDNYSISSSALKQDSKASTIFHKYKQRQKNSQSGSDKKHSKVYSVLSNGLFKIPEEQEFQDYLLNYRPMNKEFNLKQLVKEPNFHIVPGQGKVFFGQIVDQMKHGSGITVSEKQIYQGKYDNNAKTQGCQKNRDGIYTGEFVKGKRHGQGKFVWNNGETFEGEWRDGKKNGFGVWKSPKGDSYQGLWSNNRQNGEGLYFHFGGSKYRGEFKDFLKHGLGTEQFPNGDKFVGGYVEGKPHGKGKYVWANGDMYDGGFEQGSRSGYGVLRRKNGDIYEGYFLNDMKHGKGRQLYKSGQSFEGIFELGERGRGTLKTANGVTIQITQ